jgi:hypothetical protein
MEPETNLLLVIGKSSAGHHTDAGEGLATEKFMKIRAKTGANPALYRTQSFALACFPISPEAERQGARADSEAGPREAWIARPMNASPRWI